MTVSMALWEEECKGHVVVYAVIKYLPNCNHLIAALETNQYSCKLGARSSYT